MGHPTTVDCVRLLATGRGLSGRTRHGFVQALFEFIKASRLAFPDDDAAPAERSELLQVLNIASPILRKLGPPVTRIAFWHMPFAAAFVAMPEATMHKDDDLPFWKNYIRLAGEILAVQAEPIPHPMQSASNTYLGLCIPGRNASHDLGPPRT